MSKVTYDDQTIVVDGHRVPLMAKNNYPKTVMVCGKCGRGFVGKAAEKDAIIDSQPVWWTADTEGPRCNGRAVHVNRVQQIERINGGGQENGA